MSQSSHKRDVIWVHVMNFIIAGEAWVCHAPVVCFGDDVMRKLKGTLPPKNKWGSKCSEWCKTNQVAVKASCILPFGRNSTPKMVKPRFG